MPKVTKDTLDNISYSSFQDLLNNLKNYKSLSDKLAYLTRYILNHGGKEGRDLSLSQLVELGRQVIAEASGKTAQKDKEAPAHLVDKSVKDEKDDLAAEMFLSNPAEYIKGEGNKAIDEMEQEGIYTREQLDFKDNANKVIDQMDEKFNEKVFDLDKYSSYYGVKTKMEAGVGGRKALNDLYQATQPNWFSRVFSTYSAKWVALEDAYETFNNPNKVGFAKMDHLNVAATEYLKHKFPKWKPGEEIPAEAYSKLNKTELAKVNFTVNLLNATKEQAEVDKNLHSLVEANKERDIKYSDIPEKEEEEVSLDQSQIDFQNQLKEDVDLEKDSSLINSSLDESKDLVNENELNAEEEKLDDSVISNNSI